MTRREPSAASDSTGQSQRDTWRDKDADSGLRLDHWLNETQDAIRTLRMSRDGTGFGWTVVLLEGHVEVECGHDWHIDQAWSKALDKLAEVPE
jgi:hypothetical protein